MHTAQISGWIGSMLLYEVLVVDRTDTVFNPVWRQGCYAMPMVVRLGAVSSVYGWSLGISQVGSAWSYELVVVSHIVLSGLLILSSQWHWSYADLDIFISSSSAVSYTHLTLPTIRSV